MGGIAIVKATATPARTIKTLANPVAKTKAGFVFHKENDEWKIVREHVSIGVLNEVVAGNAGKVR